MSFDQEPDPLSDALEHCQRLVKELVWLRDHINLMKRAAEDLEAEVARLREELRPKSAAEEHNAMLHRTGQHPLPAPPGQSP